MFLSNLSQVKSDIFLFTFIHNWTISILGFPMHVTCPKILSSKIDRSVCLWIFPCLWNHNLGATKLELCSTSLKVYSLCIFLSDTPLNQFYLQISERYPSSFVAQNKKCYFTLGFHNKFKPPQSHSLWSYLSVHLESQPIIHSDPPDSLYVHE